MARTTLGDDPRVLAFVDLVQRYCALIEAHEDIPKKEFVTQCGLLLSHLFGAAVSLLEVPVRSTACKLLERLPLEQHRTIHKRLGKRLGEHDVYWMVFDPYSQQAPISHTLADDLAGVYDDLQAGLAVFGRTAPHSRDAIWGWRFLFTNHWGRHCASALRVIWCMLEQFDQEAPPDGD